MISRPETRCECHNNHDVLKRALERLSAAQTDILSKRFYHRKTPREFSTETGIPPERVRQREAQTLRALRCPQISRKLREYNCLLYTSSNLGLKNHQHSNQLPDVFSLLHQLHPAVFCPEFP